MLNIAVTGYYDTGSSAVLDLLAEFDGVSYAVGDRYEHYVFMAKAGLFDLESRLYGKNSNYMIQDIAINDFIDEMYKQYKYDFGWYGSYKKYFGEDFKRLVDDFAAGISVTDGKKSLSHTVKVRFSPIKCLVQLGAKLLYNRKIYKWGRIYVHDRKPCRKLLVNREDFLAEARKFVSGYFGLANNNGNDMIYDHLLFPEECGSVNEFFDDNFRLIIVDRDPRDVYISGNYVFNLLSNGGAIPPFYKDVEGFCRDWKLRREKTLKNADSDKILFLRFEDLIYDYENTVKKLAEFTGMDIKRHTDKKTKFIPEKSIDNTQFFMAVSDCDKDREYIENALKDYLYDFPYDIGQKDRKWFNV